MIRFLTSGESHGEGLTGIIDGVPANLFIDQDFINSELKRRQQGYGRSSRMTIENDKVSIISGINQDLTTGNPISIFIKNKGTNIETPEVYTPRPGHGDLVGSLKYNQKGGRNILERASARETAMRVALASICKLLLKHLDIEIYSHVISIGDIVSTKSYYNEITNLELKNSDNSDLRVVDKSKEIKMIELVKESMSNGDTLGGSIELIVKNIPVGLGSHTNWDRKLDGLLGAALFSIPGIKAVEFGLGTMSSSTLGSKFHDEIIYDKTYKRVSNNAGGIEAGISNGEDIVIKIHMKPIPTLKQPLATVNMLTKEKEFALSERSDVCAVPSASIVAEAMVSLVIANELLRKFGGDSMEELTLNFKSYRNYLKTR